MSELAERERDARRIWARPGGSHDFVVNWMKRLLPMGIGALSVFLVASPLISSKGEVSFLLAKDAVDMAAERLRIVKAVYRGQDQNGRAFTLTAGSAVQASSRVPVVRLSDVSAQLDMDDGPATVDAKLAEYDLDAQVLRVIGPVTFKSADGYRLDLTNVAIGLKTRTISGSGNGVAPQGGVTAGQARGDLDSKTATLGGGVTANTPKGTYSANSVQADIGARTAILEGGVSGNTPYGQYTARRAQADLGKRQLLLDGGVTGKMRLGSFTAGRLTADLGSRTVILDGRVHLRISQKGLK